MSSVYYNENDAHAAGWLRNLVAAGHLPAGTVDDRSILDVDPADLDGYDQVHWFAGIGGWPYALKLAGWTGPVWTGSCPCQPLSSAGQRRGHADERHLWPAFHRLIALCRPATVIGEQVASKDGREWLAGVRADMEHLGYAVGAADLPAAGVGAPHIRQRLFWVADRNQQRLQERALSGGERQAIPDVAGCGPGNVRLANPDSQHAAQERQGHRPLGGQRQAQRRRAEQSAGPGAGSRDGDGHLAQGNGGLADAEHAIGRAQLLAGEDVIDRSDDGRQEAHRVAGAYREVRGLADAADARCDDARQHDGGPPPLPTRPIERGPTRWMGDATGVSCAQGIEIGSLQRRPHEPLAGGMPWADAVWLPCLDGKARRTQPGLHPLADGVSSRVGRLRAYGNAIVPQAAAAFVSAFMECRR